MIDFINTNIPLSFETERLRFTTCDEVDKFGDTVDFILSERRNEEAATVFFKQAIDANGFPKKVVMDKRGANYVGLENINFLLALAGLISFVEIFQVKYLNNLIEQDHRFIKKITNPMWDLKPFIRQRQPLMESKPLYDSKRDSCLMKIPAYKQFMALAG